MWLLPWRSSGCAKLSNAATDISLRRVVFIKKAFYERKQEEGGSMRKDERQLKMSFIMAT